jgi:hypothetical protein
MVFWARLLGLGPLTGPVVLAWAGPTAIQVWVGAYIAGCAGGLVHELILGKGRIELPSPADAGASRDAEDTRASLGPQIDLGFFARLVSGGLGAPDYVAGLEPSTVALSAMNDASAKLDQALGR